MERERSYARPSPAGSHPRTEPCKFWPVSYIWGEVEEEDGESDWKTDERTNEGETALMEREHSRTRSSLVGSRARTEPGKFGPVSLISERDRERESCFSVVWRTGEDERALLERDILARAPHWSVAAPELNRRILALFSYIWERDRERESCVCVGWACCCLLWKCSFSHF